MAIIVILSSWVFSIKDFRKKSSFQLEHMKPFRFEVWFIVVKTSSYHKNGSNSKAKYNISKVIVFCWVREYEVSSQNRKNNHRI